MSELDEGIGSQLDQEIGELRTVLALVQLSAPVVALVSLELIDRLRRRAEGEDGDAPLDEARQVADHALGLLPADDANRAAVLTERALTLELRFQRRGAYADLDEAIGTWRRLAAEVPMSRSALAETMAHLGSLLRLRLGGLVLTADDDTIVAALTETHRTLLIARDSLAEGSPDLPETCWLLGLCWGDRYELEWDPRHLDRAIAEVDASLRLAPDRSGDRHYVLAKALHQRAALQDAAGAAEAAGQPRSDLTAALNHIQIALRMVDPTDPFRLDVLYAAATIAVAELEVSPASVDQAVLRSWADALQAHYDRADPQRATDEAQAADEIVARILAALVNPRSVRRR
jgi:hypothetical protein